MRTVQVSRLSLLIVTLALPILVGCGGGGTDLQALPHDVGLLQDCSQSSVYVDRIVAGLWNRLCPAQPAQMEGVSFDMVTGEYRIRTTVRGREVHVHGQLSMNGPLSQGIHQGETATTIFRIEADDMNGEGHLNFSPDAKFSLRVWGQIRFGNGQCDIEMDDIDMRGYASGTTARLWGNIPFRIVDFSTDSELRGDIRVAETTIDHPREPLEMDAARYVGDPPQRTLDVYEYYIDPKLYRIFG